VFYSRIFTLGAFALFGIGAAGSSSEPACLAPSEYSDWAIADFRWTDTTSDTATVSRRQRWNLPVVSVSQIAVVSDTTKCRRAVNAYNTALLPDSAVSASVYLFSYGPTRYIAVDTSRHAGEWDMHIVFDTSFSSPLQIFRR
jgi:hypothetical protein